MQQQAQVDPAYSDNAYDYTNQQDNTYLLPVAAPTHTPETPMTNAISLNELSEDTMRSLIQQMADAIVERSGLRQEINALKDQVERLSNDLNHERGVVRDLQEKIEAGPRYEARINELEMGRDADQHTIEVLKRELEEARETARELTAEVSDWQNRCQTLTEDYEGLNSQYLALDATHDTLRADHERVCKERHELEQVANRVHVVEDELNHCRESRQSWEAHAREAWNKTHSLQEQSETQATRMAEVRALIEQAQAKLAA